MENRRIGRFSIPGFRFPVFHSSLEDVRGHRDVTCRDVSTQSGESPKLFDGWVQNRLLVSVNMATSGSVRVGVRRFVSGTALGAAMMWCVAVSPANAHSGTPPDINFWGPFDPATAQCQRVVGSAVQRCFERVLAEYRHCM